MHISYDSTELIDNVKNDISLYGASFKVYAIFKCFEGVNFVVDYVDAEKPTMKEAETISEFQQILKEFTNNINSLKNKKYQEMCLSELLPLLIEQDGIF